MMTDEDELNVIEGRLSRGQSTTRDQLWWLVAQAREANALRKENEAIKEALGVKDTEDGCCAPGEWCHYKTWTELALDYTATIKERDALRAEVERLRASVRTLLSARETSKKALLAGDRDAMDDASEAFEDALRQLRDTTTRGQA